MVETNTPAGNSRGYALGANRIFGNIELTNTFSHTYNAELVKQLSSAMQTKIAGYGGPLGHRVAIDRDGTGAVIGFMGKLQSADAILGPWNEVPGATKQYAVPASSGAKFYRAAE